MWTPLDESRACAPSRDPAPEAIRTQKLTELSGSAAGRPLASAWNWPAPFARRRPYEPVCAEAASTVAPPFPRRPSHAESEPDSNPSEYTTLVYDPAPPSAALRVTPTTSAAARASRSMSTIGRGRATRGCPRIGTRPVGSLRSAPEPTGRRVRPGTVLPAGTA